jgi:hypothetical protein
MPRAEERPDGNAKRFSVTLILGIVLPLLVLFLVYTFQFRQLADSNTIDIAQVARNIAAGKRFTTSVVRPLATTRSKDVLHMPDMVQAPAYPVALAVVFGANASDRKVFATAGLFYLLTIVALFSLAKGMFNKKVAQLAVFAYVTSAFVLNIVAQAGSGAMAGFVFTVMCLALFRFAQQVNSDAPDARKRVLLYAVLSGLAFALCYLTDYMLLFAFLPVALFVYYSGGRNKGPALGAFLVGFAVLALPWMIRNAMLTGNPFFGLRALEIGMATAQHPGMSLYRSTVPTSVLSLLQETQGDIFRKFWAGVNQGYSGFPILGQPYLMAFFIAGLFYSFRRTGVNAMRAMVIGAFFLTIICGSMFFFQLGTVAAFAPVMLAFAAAYFIRVMNDANLHSFVSKSVTGLVAVVLCIPVVTLVIQPNAARPVPHDLEQAVSQYVATDVPILTDRAFETTWYAARTTIWLPDTDKDVENLDQTSKLKAIYLSSNLHPTVRTTENYDTWRGMYQPIFEQATKGQFARLSDPPLTDFALYRDMPPEQAVQFLQKGALLLLRPGASRGPAK